MGSTCVATLVMGLMLSGAALGSTVDAGQTISSTSSEPAATSLVVVNNVTQASNQSDDTVRVDPLDDFKKYRGGYDIANKHYWSSTIFTGIYGYAIGVLWLLAGIGYGGFLLATLFCWRRNGKLKKISLCHKQCFLWHIPLAIFFTLLAITASGLIFGGNARFRSQARTVIDIILETADDASQTIYNTTGAMRGIAESIGASNENTSIISGINIGTASSFLTSTSDKLDVEADDIQRQTRKNRRLIDKGLRIVYIITTVTISLNLAAVIALSVCGTLRLRRALNWLVILCWLLTALCWLLFGLYFFLDNFSKDSCTAIENFQQNPYNNSLSSIIPCDELQTAKPVISEVSMGIYNFVNELNANISASYSGLLRVCNPFSGPPEYQYQPDNCSSNTIKIGNIPKVLNLFTCSDSNNGSCGQLSLSPSEYNAVAALATSIQNLLDSYPEIESLVECQSVKDAFSKIITKHCKPLKKYVHMVWASMVFLSMVIVFLVLAWTVQARHEQQNHPLDGSVKPHSDPVANEAESGTQAGEERSSLEAPSSA